MKLGIVGLPNVGKSTLFNAMTGGGAQAANYPFCTIDPNVGIVRVPDDRIDALARMHSPEKITYATIEFVDIAGLVKGAAQGEGLGNKFLSHIREVDAIVHVVRCFVNDDIVHVDSRIDPVSDVQTINYELLLSDIEILERKLERAVKRMKGDKTAASEVNLCKKLLDAANEGINIRNVELSAEESELLSDTPLLSMKPIIYAANIGEEDIGKDMSQQNDGVKALLKLAESENAKLIPVCAEIEAQLSELDSEERRLFLEDFGLKRSTLDNLIEASYDLLGLISFLTAGKPEVRAWTVRRGTPAPQAAGKIHSDIERGFIRAEVIAFDDLMKHGSMTAAKEAGAVRSEGKEYVMQDGDIVLFRFNV